MRGDTIELTLPSEPKYLLLVRLLASGIGSLGGLDVEGVDDLRLAVDELCSALLARGDGSMIELRFDVADDEMLVRGQTAAGASTVVDAAEDGQRVLGLQILAAVADRYELRQSHDRVSFMLEKRRGTSSGGR